MCAFKITASYIAKEQELFTREIIIVANSRTGICHFHSIFMALTRRNQPGAAGPFYQGIPDFFLKESNSRLMAGVIVATFMSNYH